MSERENREKSATGSSNKEMTEQHAERREPGAVSPERIAALLDGRLDGKERAALLAEIDGSPEAFEAYSDALAVLRELEGGEAGNSTVPTNTVVLPRARNARKWRVVTWVGIAAAASLVVSITIRSRAFGERDLPDADSMLGLISNAAGVSTPASQAPPWNERRGGSDDLSPTSRSIRIGARIADLEALRLANDSSVRRLASEIAGLLDGVPGGSAAAVDYRAMATAQSSVSSADMHQAAANAEKVAGADEVRLGFWLEAARIAIAGQDTAFFHTAPASGARRTIERLPGTTPETRSLSAQLSAAFDGSRFQPNAGPLITELLRQLAG